MIPMESRLRGTCLSFLTQLHTVHLLWMHIPRPYGALLVEQIPGPLLPWLLRLWMLLSWLQDQWLLPLPGLLLPWLRLLWMLLSWLLDQQLLLP